MNRRAFATLALLALAAAVAGCAGLRARRVRAERLEARLDALRYARPLDEVWQEVRLLLDAQGYPLAGADAEAIGRKPPAFAERLFSPARETRPYREEAGLLQRLRGEGAAADGPRGLSLDTGRRRAGDFLHADAIEDGGGVRVLLWRIEDDPTEHRGRPARDLELELALARRVAPAAAAEIEAALASP